MFDSLYLIEVGQKASLSKNISNRTDGKESVLYIYKLHSRVSNLQRAEQEGHKMDTVSLMVDILVGEEKGQ